MGESPMHRHHATRRARRAESAFSLIEIMVVIAILGMLLTVVGRSAWNNMKEARVTTTQTKMNQLAHGALTDYIRRMNKAPDSLEELLVESEKNYGDSWAKPVDLRDAWDNQLRYEKVGNTKFRLTSLGADGIEGGEFDEGDIVWPDDFED